MQVLHKKVPKQDWAYALSLTLILLYHKPFAPTISKPLMLQMALKRGECGEQTQVACKDACAVVQYLSLHKCFLRPLEVAGTATEPCEIPNTITTMDLIKYPTMSLYLLQVLALSESGYSKVICHPCQICCNLVTQHMPLSCS